MNDDYAYYTNVITASLYDRFGNEHVVKARYTPARLYGVIYTRMLLSGVQIVSALIGLILYIVALATPGGTEKHIDALGWFIVITIATLWAIAGAWVNTFKIESNTGNLLQAIVIIVAMLGLVVPNNIFGIVWLGIEIVLMATVGFNTIDWDFALMNLVEIDEVANMRAKNSEKTKD